MLRKVRMLALLLVISAFNVLFAQKGKISGKVFDKNNQPVVGAVVKAGNNPQVTTDIDGRFLINLEVGKYTLTVSHIGYDNSIIDNVEAKSAPEDLQVFLQEKSSDLQNVTVQSRSTKRLETTNALIQFQKNTNTVASVISAEAIRRSPDRNTGDVLRRTPGVSLLDGKFLVVRGLSDRYNQALLNGILLTSTEPDRKAFSFDIIPAQMLDNIIINKAFVPEMPGEWAGGLIQINTKDIPTKNFFNVQVGTGANTQAFGKDFYKQKSGGLDWLGIDNGYHGFPNGYTTKNQFRLLTVEQKNAIGKNMNDDWMANIKKGSPNIIFQANGGFSGTLFGKKIGGVLGINYYRNNNIVKMINRDNILNADRDGFGTPNNSWNDTRYNQQTSLGGLAGLTMQLNNKNKISLKSLINVNSNSYTIYREGIDDIFEGYGEENSFKQNTFFTTQLIGEHAIVDPLKLKWYGAFSILDGYSPDQRRYMYMRTAGTNNPYELQIGDSYDIRSSNRLYQSLSDYIYTAGGDLSYNFDMFGSKQTLKGGYMLQVKDRLYDATMFVISLPGGNSALRQLDADQAFAPDNFGTGANQLRFDILNNSDLRYMANTILNTGYLQFDNNFTEKLRVVWGARIENYDQLVGSQKTWSNKFNHTKQTDVLPGINATYKLNNLTNLRLSASQTVIRPELRELASLSLYDFELNASVNGNPSLLRTKVTNLDLRYELYQKAGEMFTVGAFYKHFQNPIEQQLASDGQNFTFDNVAKANSYGAEIELRKKLDFINTLRHFTFQANGSYIYSRVKDERLNVNRPMVGQSPYLINMSLMYDLEEKGLSTTLMFNQIGKRIYLLGSTAGGGSRPDVWEASRPVLDWLIAQKVWKQKGEFRLSVSNILNNTLYFYQNANGNTSLQKNIDAYRFTRQFGTNFNLTFNYNL
ncbi:MAG: hypothetical protein DI598_09740 [Pseudopedobacter saltans]|uniref:Uncharacterized protein n=1 Tax=Pseudopedobacter saltans TaxID=151895 RepID=A0A2W5GYZ3_9SPHI|nr:MAG: hypothetical protein DI598_09740 [Pseudopedobacter saltans]